jgi:hypothetical protein
MQCCNSMPCSSPGHHGQDCCKTMHAVHAPFVQPSSVQSPSFFHSVFAAIPASGKSLVLDSSALSVAAQCHAPPIVCSPALRPLRI